MKPIRQLKGEYDESCEDEFTDIEFRLEYEIVVQE